MDTPRMQMIKRQLIDLKASIVIDEMPIPCIEATQKEMTTHIDEVIKFLDLNVDFIKDMEADDAS